VDVAPDFAGDEYPVFFDLFVVRPTYCCDLGSCFLQYPGVDAAYAAGAKDESFCHDGGGIVLGKIEIAAPKERKEGRGKRNCLLIDELEKETHARYRQLIIG
jgi:hypothetical protein